MTSFYAICLSTAQKKFLDTILGFIEASAPGLADENLAPRYPIAGKESPFLGSGGDNEVDRRVTPHSRRQKNRPPMIPRVKHYLRLPGRMKRENHRVPFLDKDSYVHRRSLDTLNRNGSRRLEP
jgi:hypothetical protein